jgi:Ca-activated chloride channel homolog
MRRIVGYIIVFFLSFAASAQMTFNTLKHNFGDLQSYDSRFIDVQITNFGSKDGYILSVRKPAEVVYIQSRTLVKKDSTLTLRFQVNPMQKGKFKYTVDIYTSDKNDAHQLVLTGNLLEMETNQGSYLTACPDFNTHPIGRNPNQFDLMVVTIDKDTRQELSQSKVLMLQDGFVAWNEKTDKNGRIKKPGTNGLAYFYAEKDGYFPVEKGAFITVERNRVVIEMTKQPTLIPEPELVVETKQPPIEIEIDLTTPQPIDSLVVDLKEPGPNVEVEEIVEETKEPVQSLEEIVQLEDLDENNFDARFFAQANIVFVIDVSGSMTQANKMELMKYSLNQLTDMLRADDKMALVAYASIAKIILPSTPGSEKEKIHGEVKKLRASGMTAGGEGIRLGLEEAKTALIPNGMNHVFVITDGAFNQKQYDYKKMIKKYTDKNIQLSVVGILNDDKSEVSMREIAAIGKGEYIPIFKLSDAEKNIKQTVRKLAFKTR